MVQDPETLDALAANVKKTSSNADTRVAKTFVISRDAADLFAEVARRWNIARDDLVEASIEHLIPLIQKEQIRHDSRKRLFVRMEQHLKRARALFEDMKAELGDSDPMCIKMGNAIAAYERALGSVGKYIEKGKNIENF
jgi:hypothetical protein